MQIYDVTATFTEPLLGTAPLNKEVYKDWILPPDNPDLSELDTINEAMEKGSTGFHRLPDGSPFLYDYVIKGFFKDACGMLARDSESSSSKLRAFRKVIDGLLFVGPRRIPIVASGDISWLERPLRAQTAQGERVALARSEALPEGSTIQFIVEAMGPITPTLLREWLTYGELRGLGQWRNASYGRFKYEMTKR